MYNEQEYFYGWVYYIVVYVAVIAAGWYLTHWIKLRELKWNLRVAAVVIFILPWYAVDGERYLAPAWLIAGFEGVFDGADAFWRAGTPLIVATSISVLLATSLLLYLRFKK